MDLHLVKPDALLDFGETTWDLEEKFESVSGPREFIPQEHFSLSKPERLGGLRDVEIEMIIQVVQHENSLLKDRAEILGLFSQSDGYLEYFSHGPSQRQFVTVGHFPADNEAGAIFEIRVRPQGVELIGKLAQVDDGAIIMILAADV